MTEQELAEAILISMMTGRHSHYYSAEIEVKVARKLAKEMKRSQENDDEQDF